MEVFKIRKSVKKPKIDEEYKNGELGKYKWIDCPIKSPFANPWIGTVAITNADDSKAKQKVTCDKDPRGQVNDKNKNDDKKEKSNVNNGEKPTMPNIMDPFSDGQNKVVYVYNFPYAPGALPMMSPNIPGMMPPGMMTPMYGGSTPQYTYSSTNPFSADPDVPPHLRKHPVRIPLDTDLYSVPTDPREERIQNGEYGIDEENLSRPFKLPELDFAQRLRIIEKNHIRDNTLAGNYEDKNVYDLHQQNSTSGNSSDSEISPPFEPIDNLCSVRSVQRQNRQSASTSGNESDDSHPLLEFVIKNEHSKSPMRIGKRKRRESVRIRENETKRQKVDPIIISKRSSNGQSSSSDKDKKSK